MDKNQTLNDSQNTAADTKTRILNAAETLYAIKGYHAASVRRITTRAGSNVAAVNYYFGGKENLYTEVFRRSFQTLADIRVNSINDYMAKDSSNINLEGLLTAFSHAFLQPLVDKSGNVILELMVREMLDPHLPAGMFFEQTIMPVLVTFQKALLKICPRLTPDVAILCIRSVISQLLHIILAKKVFPEVGEGLDTKSGDLFGVDHIVRFSAAAIRDFQKGAANV